MSLEGKNTVVWGDGRGVGEAIAAAFADAGATVSRGMGGGGNELAALVDEAAAEGPLDALVICLETAPAEGPIVDLSDAAFAAEVERGLGITFRGIRAALRSMLPAEAGRIVVTTSVEAKLPHADSSAHVAVQHGVSGLVKSVAHEVGRKGIGVNAIVCGVLGAAEDPVEEDLLTRSALKRPMTPVEVAAAAVLLADPDHPSLTGTLFPAHGGLIPY